MSEASSQEAKKEPLKILKEGLLLKFNDRQIAEPGHYALGTLSAEAKKSQQSWRYANEILRVLSELKLTIWLIDHVPTAEEMSSLEQGPEDVILFYEGAFPELTHQLKDKILGLLESLLGLSHSKGTGKRIRKILERAKERGLDIGAELKAWDAEDEPQSFVDVIKGVLNIRKHHHHRLSKIPLNNFYQDVKISRLASQDPLKGYLTDFGRSEMKKRGSEGFQKLKKQAHEKMESSLVNIQENISALAEKLIEHFQLSYTLEELQAHMKKQEALEQQLKIHNPASLEKIPDKLRSEVEKFVASMSLEDMESIRAIYSIGSIPRGEFNPLFSDINFCIIVQNERLKDVFAALQPRDLPLSVQIFTEAEFGDPNNLLAKKYRFICEYDGVLMSGIDCVGKGAFPKPGAELAWLLNHDFFDKMRIIEEWVRINPQAKTEAVGAKSKEVLKLIFDATYAVAMTNDPRYIHNRIARIEFTDRAFPKNAKIMKFFKNLYLSGGIANLDGLIALIEKGKEIGGSVLNQLKPIVDKLDESTD